MPRAKKRARQKKNKAAKALMSQHTNRQDVPFGSQLCSGSGESRVDSTTHIAYFVFLDLRTSGMPSGTTKAATITTTTTIIIIIIIIIIIATAVVVLTAFYFQVAVSKCVTNTSVFFLALQRS